MRGSRDLLAGVLAVAALTMIAGCATGSSERRKAARPRPIGLTHAERVAYGRPASCPDDAVDVFGDGRPGPDDLRCSYDDVAGGAVVRLEGHVRREGREGDLGDPLGETTVLVHEVRPDGSTGRVVARATTDRQGRFSVGAVLVAGEYLLVAPATPTRAFRRFDVAAGTRKLSDLNLLVAQ